ncbi:cytochrome P450 [Cryphonectria parasitica EP155]|uniref:Cytochrome P450 n=1 Tax=Cryphonectria parasitica (strain ATCC 38755 / EP155) TaxID=660469 RepID=A0A9P4XXR0_CRYP1|nr:cytochrome P450 [Cryphonectria parasitica EP155]KAF3762848.1 cytochrome P450 [Cryphonectria parasitica EP155]
MWLTLGAAALVAYLAYYFAIRSASGDRHIHFLELHNKYGPFVRFALNRISVNTTEGLQKIYGAKDNTQKSCSLTSIDHSLHLKKKRVMSSALSDSSVRAMEDIVLRNIINSRLSDICFSNSFDMLDKPDNRYILKVLPLGVNALSMSGWMPGVLRLKLGKILFSKLNEDMKRYEAFANEPLFSDHDLVRESSLLITGTTAISATFFYLLHNLHAYQRIKDEVRPCLKSVDEIVGCATLISCRWLRVCIDEAMRMSPDVPGLLLRHALAGDVEIAGHVFPEGVDLGVCHYSIHHNEEYCPDSFCYRLERCLEVRSTNSKSGHEKAAFCTFSIGLRGCAGKSMAMKELLVTITRFVWLYNMRLAPIEEYCGARGSGKGYSRHRIIEYQMQDIFVSRSDRPQVQFRRLV